MVIFCIIYQQNLSFTTREYEVVYVNENGYITLGTGESFLCKIYYKIIFPKPNKCNVFKSSSTTDITDSESEIFIGTGKYGEKVFTFQKYFTNTVEGNIRIDFKLDYF